MKFNLIYFIYFTGNPSGIFNAQPSQSTLSALVSQHRLLELSRFGLRGYDLAQQMLTQQGAVSKLLGKSFLFFLVLLKHICNSPDGLLNVNTNNYWVLQKNFMAKSI